MKLVINNVSDAESPLEYSPWALVSFDRRDANHIVNFNPGGVGIRQKMRGATAFLLDYFEHGLCAWSLRGEGTQCRWDTTGCAGIILGDYKELKHLSHEDRRQDARDMVHRYTDWCNGSVYEYALVTEHVCSQCTHRHLNWGDAEWSGTWYDTDDMLSFIRSDLKHSEHKLTGISGDAAWLADHHELAGVEA